MILTLPVCANSLFTQFVSSIIIIFHRTTLASLYSNYSHTTLPACVFVCLSQDGVSSVIIIFHHICPLSIRM
jgi:hypothetical protein